jgi:hypothetical protein
MLKPALLCSILLAAGCGDDLVIGTAEQDAGSEAEEQQEEEAGGLSEDQLLAQYAKDLAGEWAGQVAPGTVVVLTFTPSATRPRSGTFTVECDCDDAGAPRGTDFKREYWLVKLDEGRATVLAPGPLPSGLFDGSFVYDPKRMRIESAIGTFTPRGGKVR